LAYSTSSSTPSSGQPADDSNNVTVLIGCYKDPFGDVCLCEFGANDMLHLLSRCSHAFHLKCIDAWLVSHFTCPLCHSSLLPDASPASSCSPLVFILESRVVVDLLASRQWRLLDRDTVVVAFLFSGWRLGFFVFLLLSRPRGKSLTLI
ncbi:hypothetical protein Taro_032913, partial [Colocasia esculenta]|nr:hypothetical protein [Colocasia esculenta]